MKNTIYILLATSLLIGCEQLKWDYDENFVVLTTFAFELDSIHINKAWVESEVEGITEGFSIEAHGHVWSSSVKEPTTEINDGMDRKQSKSADGTFDSEISDLKDATTYYVRAFAQIGDKITYGDSKSFNTNKVQVYTGTLKYGTGDMARLRGCLHAHLIDGETVDEDVTIDEHGFCWSTVNEVPKFERDQVIKLGPKDRDGDFSALIKNLEDGLTYHYRAFVITRFGADTIYATTEGRCPGSVEEDFPKDIISWEANLKNIWKERKILPEAPLDDPSFTYDGKGYVYARYERKLLAYDPVEDEWSSINADDAYRTVVNIGDFAYFMIGADGLKCRRYDLENGGWEDIEEFQGDYNNDYYVNGFAPGNGNGYVIIGNHYCWEYNSNNNKWKQKQNYKGTSQGLLFSFVVNGHGYLGGGGTKELYRFNHDDNNWEEKGNLLEGETYYTATFTIDQTAYIGVGGSNGAFYSKSFWAYDYLEDEWSPITDFKGSVRNGAFGFAIGSSGYVGAGTDTAGGELYDFWEYKKELD